MFVFVFSLVSLFYLVAGVCFFFLLCVLCLIGVGFVAMLAIWRKLKNFEL